MSDKQNAQGVVGYVGSKDYKGRTYWSIKLDNDDNWYRTGTFKPSCKKGDYVSFEYEVNQWGNQVDSRAIVVKQDVGAATAAPSQAAKKTAPQATTNKDGYWERKEAKDEDRQNVISYQAAHNTAAAICSAAVANDILPLPAKKNEKFDAFVDAVRTLALDLYSDFSSVYEGNDPRIATESADVNFSDMDDFNNEGDFSDE